MYELLTDTGGGSPKGNSLQDMHYEICLSYIRHASHKLAYRESQLMHQSTIFLASMASHDKSITEPSSTEASFENRQCIHAELSPRAAERKAFMRRSKRGGERPTLRSREQALQEVKEVCSEPTIAVIQVLLGDYHRLVMDITKNDFKESFFRKKCENCLAKAPQHKENELRCAQLEQRLKKVSGELRNTMGKNEQLARQLSSKLCELDKFKTQIQPQEALKAFLKEKEDITVARLQEVKLIERDILLRLEGISSEEGGCQRCKCVRAIKGQLLQFRRYLERQAENLQSLYSRMKQKLLVRKDC